MRGARLQRSSGIRPNGVAVARAVNKADPSTFSTIQEAGRMPRYHFNVFDGVTALDQEGSQLANTDHARREAMCLASDMLRSESRSPKVGEEWRIEVTDDRGLIIFRIDVMLTGSAAVSG